MNQRNKEILAVLLSPVLVFVVSVVSAILNIINNIIFEGSWFVSISGEFTFFTNQIICLMAINQLFVAIKPSQKLSYILALVFYLAYTLYGMSWMHTAYSWFNYAFVIFVTTLSMFAPINESNDLIE